MDHKKIEKAVQLFLEGIGEDCTREGLAETPKRIANMCEQLFGGYEQDAEKHLSRTFHADTGNMVVEKDITFYSVCEHHFLPFYGKVHIGYIPDGKVVGLSKLARTGRSICQTCPNTGTADGSRLQMPLCSRCSQKALWL